MGNDKAPEPEEKPPVVNPASEAHSTLEHNERFVPHIDNEYHGIKHKKKIRIIINRAFIFRLYKLEN